MITPHLPSAGQIHLFYTRADKLSDPGLSAQYRACLCPVETARADRYIKPADRHLSRVSRALVRYVTAGMTRQDAHAICFSANEYGKPFLVDRPDLHFNLSHSSGGAVCAVCPGASVGVDLEDTGRPVNISISRRFFSSCEAEQILNASSPEEGKELFFEIWTLKEAYVKAVGKGLSIPLDSFSFQRNCVNRTGDTDIHIMFSDTGKIDPMWRFFQWRPEPGKIVAAAVRSDDPVVFRPFFCVPFVGITPAPPASGR